MAVPVDTRERSERRVRRGPISQSEVDERNALIAQVATEEFLAKGFRGASMSEIARRARVGKATLYGLFRSKEDLFRHVTANSLPDFRRQLSSALDPEAPFESVIRTVVALFMASRRDRKAMAMLRLAVAERDSFPSLADIAHQSNVDLVRPFAKYLEAKAIPAELDERASQWRAYQLMSMAVGGYSSMLFRDDALLPEKEWTESVVEMFIPSFPLRANAK
jgi:AcrR family transcriptional regulator